MKEPLASMSFCILVGSVFGWIAPISTISDVEPSPSTSNVTCGTALIGQLLTPGRHDALFLIGSPNMAGTDIIYDDCVGPLCIFDETTVRTYTMRTPVTYCIIHDISGYEIYYIRDYEGCYSTSQIVFVTVSQADEIKTEGDLIVNSTLSMNNLMNIYIYKCFSPSGTIQDEAGCIYYRSDYVDGSRSFEYIIFKSWEDNTQAYCNRIYPDWRVITATIASGISVLFTAGGVFYKLWVVIHNHLSKTTLNTEDKSKTSQLSINPEGI
jgi:hypothetical protein